MDPSTLPLSNKRAFRLLRKVCKKFGIQISRRASKKDTLWDGKKLHLQEKGNISCPLYVLVHEISHWVMAPPSRRWKWDFGLREEDSKFGNVEEFKARVMDVALLMYVGVSFKKACPHLYYLYYYCPHTKSAVDMPYFGLTGNKAPEGDIGALLYYTTLLENNGYLRNGRPTFLINQGMAKKRK